MKTKKNFSKKRFPPWHMGISLLLLLLAGIRSNAQTAGTAIQMTLQAMSQISPNTFEFDIMLKNTGTTSLALRAYSCGMNYTTGLANGGTLSFSYMTGSRDAVFATIPVATTAHVASLNHLRVVTVTAVAGNEVSLTAGVNYKLGRFSVQTSAASFPACFNPWLPAAPSAILQVITMAGRTQCVATCYVNYPATTNYSLFGIGNTPTATSLNVLTGVVTPSPTGATPFILNQGTTCNPVYLKFFIEGYWDGVSAMLPVRANQFCSPPNASNVTAEVTVELRNALSPHTLVASQPATLMTDGSCTITFSGTNAGSYFIVVKHCNMLETWSSSAVNLSTLTLLAPYDFSNALSKAYDDDPIDGVPSMKQISTSPLRYAFHSGDINQDGNISLGDLAQVWNAINNFSFGCICEDINGDGNVDLLDSPIPEINQFQWMKRPY